MNINIKATNIELTDGIREQINKCIESIEKVLGGDTQAMYAQVEVAKTTNHHQNGEIYRAEINLDMGGELLRASADKENIHAALEEMKEEISREVKRKKTKNRASVRSGAARAKDMLKGFFKRK